jgi:hypothetical protein
MHTLTIESYTDGATCPSMEHQIGSGIPRRTRPRDACNQSRTDGSNSAGRFRPPATPRAWVNKIHGASE